MIEEKLRKILKERIRIADENQDEWDFGIEQCWNEEIEILTRDMAKTISFIGNDCSDDTFCWIGEVFEDVARVTQSKEFVSAIKERAEKVVNDADRHSVYVDISFAEEKIII